MQTKAEIANAVEVEGLVAKTKQTTAMVSPRASTLGDQLGILQFDNGYLSPYFVTNPERMEVVFEDAYILICATIISSKQNILPVLNQMTELDRPLLIVAEDVVDAALAALVVEKLRGPLRVAAVRAPGSAAQRREALQYLANFTGAPLITEGLDIALKNIRVADLGRARKVTVGKNSTVVESEPQPYAQSKARIAPMQFLQTGITWGTSGRLSA